jgi:superfamily II DNA or RNA helicase
LRAEVYIPIFAKKQWIGLLAFGPKLSRNRYTNEDLVINAVAGSGKTTTLIEYARTRPVNSKILYLAFNKTVKTEAIQKFNKAELKNGFPAPRILKKHLRL